MRQLGSGAAITTRTSPQAGEQQGPDKTQKHSLGGAGLITSGLGRAASGSRGGSLVLPPRPGWRDLAGRCWHARPLAASAPPTNPAPEPTDGRQPDRVRTTSLAPPLAPGGPSACQASTVAPFQGQGRPSGQASRGGEQHERGERETLFGNLWVRRPCAGHGCGGDVGGLVVQLAADEAVPQDLQPAVAERAQGGVVAFAPAPLLVVELPRPPRARQAAERPLLDGVGQVTVAGLAGADHQLALARAAGDRRLARVALQGVRRAELLGMVADLAGHPGGKAVTEARKAQVDLAARDRAPRLFLTRLLGSPRAWGAKQQLAHAPLPPPPLRPDRQQLGGGQPDGVGLGPHQVVPGVKWSPARAAVTLSARRSGQPCRLARAKATSSWREVAASRARVGHCCSSFSMVGPPRSSPAMARAAGKVDSRSWRSRLS